MYKAKEVLEKCSKCGQKGILLVVDKGERYMCLCLFCNSEDVGIKE